MLPCTYGPIDKHILSFTKAATKPQWFVSREPSFYISCTSINYIILYYYAIYIFILYRCQDIPFYIFILFSCKLNLDGLFVLRIGVYKSQNVITSTTHHILISTLITKSFGYTVHSVPYYQRDCQTKFVLRVEFYGNQDFSAKIIHHTFISMLTTQSSGPIVSNAP